MLRKSTVLTFQMELAHGLGDKSISTDVLSGGKASHSGRLVWEIQYEDCHFHANQERSIPLFGRHRVYSHWTSQQRAASLPIVTESGTKPVSNPRKS